MEPKDIENPIAEADFRNQLQKANFMQIRDLTDEEWMALPKEEIIQLYKNCYKILEKQINRKIITDDEIYSEIERRYVYLEDGIEKIWTNRALSFGIGAKWMRKQLTEK